MNQSNNKTGIFLPPLHILANITLLSKTLKTQITVHRLMMDCGLGFLFHDKLK